MDSAASSSSSLFRWPTASHTALALTTTVVATAAALVFARSALWPRWARVLPSPLKTVIPHTSKEDLAKLVYRPDQFPGARDVETPYGSIRVYEWGPVSGPKVLLVHGISTPCITLTRIAHGLVNRGCRVMLFDLFGRGFTDGVGDLPHDDRLYTSQILLVLASSSLAWTGDDAFRLIGYSLGGGIAVHFAVTFPHVVSSLVLLAPAGLVRTETFGLIQRFLFRSGHVPERILAYLARFRLQQPLASATKARVPGPSSVGPVEIAVAEAADLTKDETLTPLEHHVLLYIRWMVVHHAGFIPSFLSSIRNAPLTEQHESWKFLAQRKPGATAIILAEGDEIIDAEYYEREGLPLVGGKDHVVWRVLHGNHDFVMTQASSILKELDDLWKIKAT